MKSHRDDLQGLRAIAVLLVVAAHTGIPGLHGGFVGVDVFFVLSGFLITGLLLHEAAGGRPSIGEFYKRRARRILPAATLTLITTVVAAYLLLNYVRAKQVMTDSVWASFFAANIHFSQVGTDYFARAQPPSPLQHFWTLAVEEQFYLVWPALLILILAGKPSWHRRRLRFRLRHRPATPARLATLTAVAGTVTVCSLALSILADGSTGSYFSTVDRAWELGLGALLAVAATRWTLPRRGATLAAWTGIAMIVTAGVAYSSHTRFPGYAALLPTIGAALIIAAGTHLVTAPARLLGTPPLRYIGDRSYGFYLWHWPILTIAAQHAGHSLTTLQNVLLAAAAFAVADITYRIYENPIRRSDPDTGAAVFAALAATAVVVFAAAVLGSRLDARAEAATAKAAPAPTLPVAATPTVDPNLLNQIAKEESDGVLVSVKKAAALASRSAPIPAGLTPAPSQLLHSEYQFPPGCAASDGDTSSSVCKLGDTAASRTIVVFGDSHAEMWMPAIVALADQDRWTVIPLVKSGCTPHEWLQGGECGAWYRWAVATTKTVAPEVVVSAGAYTATDTTLAPVAFTSLQNAVAGKHRRFVVITDVPEPAWQPVDCLLAAHSNLGTCSFVDNSGGPVAAAVQDAGGRVIDPDGWLCDGTVCPLVVGTTVVYQDPGHLTAAYAAELAAPFAAAFRQATR